MNVPEPIRTTFLIVGGGIAGVSCLETLRHLCPDKHVTIVTESALIKTVTKLVTLGKSLTRFSVAERDANESGDPFVRIITGDRLRHIHSAERYALTANGTRIAYTLLCLCTGARPLLIPQAAEFPQQVIGIRDTESVAQFEQRISGAKRITIVGNGGIASECAYAVRSVHVDWIIKDAFVAQTFADPGAAEFFRKRISSKDVTAQQPIGPVKRLLYEETGESGTKSTGQFGAALGPDWHRKWQLLGAASDDGQTESSSIAVHSNCSVAGISTSPDGSSHPLLVRLTNDGILETDLIVSATGVMPDINFKCVDVDFRQSEDGGLLVDELQRTNVPGVYAAGDCCTANWTKAEHWHQMRLWTQARQMGCMAGRAMAANLDGSDDELLQDFCFELFGHVTQLFGYQIVLLGKFNGQGLGQDYEALIRTTPDLEYIKYVIKDGRVQGAILIGETGLEETTENLILNALDVTPFGDRLLDPDIDIEDYFD